MLAEGSAEPAPGARPQRSAQQDRWFRFDAAAVMAGSAVDAMLKHFDLVEGSVYSRIDQAVSKHILTEAMGEWAHMVRLEANRPRHADTEDPHVSPRQAQQSVEFAEALGHFLFVLSSRVKKGIEEAKADEDVASPGVRHRLPPVGKRPKPGTNPLSPPFGGLT